MYANDTQYCPISAFFVSASYWLYSVPGWCTCKHRRWCSLWQQLLLILRSIRKRYCTHSHSYDFLIFCVSLLLSSSRSSSSDLVCKILNSNSDNQNVPLQCSWNLQYFLALIEFSDSIIMALLFTHDMYETSIPVVLDKNLIHFFHCSYPLGYHANMNIWSLLLGEFLRCKKNVENEHDVHALAIKKDD